MENCEYKNIPQNSKQYTKLQKNTDWKPFVRQLLVCSGVWTSQYLFGMCVGAPTMFIPQIRREANKTEIITEDMACWLSSVYNFSGFPFVIIISIVTRFIGRKMPFTIAVLDTLAAFIVLYCSTNVTHILISNIMQGFFAASQTTITIMILNEYVSPKYRRIFFTVKTATFYWGIWASNAIGSFLHWKNIPLIGIVCAMYIVLTLFIWSESPYWLASKGGFEECAASHRSLKGCNEDSEKELKILINSQKEYIACCGSKKLSAIERVFHFFKTIKCKEFYKPTLRVLANVTGFLGFSSGKLIFAVYAIDVLKKITNSESTAYVAMLMIDGFTVLSMYAGCTLSKHLNRRTLLFAASSIGVMFLFILSLYSYLISLNIIVENKYATISLFVTFSIAVSCGPLLVSVSLYGELIPLRSRNLSTCYIALFGKFVTALFLKLAPLLFKNFGLHGTCLAFGVASVICLIILFKYLPETKEKTLNGISDSMKDVQPSSRGEVSAKLLVNNKYV